MTHTVVRTTAFCVLLVFLVSFIHSQELSQEGGEARPAQSVLEGLPDEQELRFSVAPADEEAPVGAEVGAFGVWDLVRMVVVLLLVIAAVYGTITLLRRRTVGGGQREDSVIKVLQSRSLGTTGEIHAVMVGSSVLLVGAGEGGVQLIKEITDQETIDELVLSYSIEGSRRDGGFAGMVRSLFGNTPSTGEGRDNSGDFLRQQASRLRKMR